MKPAYYSEIDPYCAAWLRNLINAGLIPAGDVDERDIRAVHADDLAGYGQKHLFCGIAGWALACRLAGYPDDADILTGSPPCQPFSVAGRQAGVADDRHLWPEMARLAASLRPAAVAVENVANIVGMALDGMLLDLETAGYCARAFVVPACAVDAPHRRDRVWIAAKAVGDAAGAGRREGRAEHGVRGGRATAAGAGGAGAVADAGQQRRDGLDPLLQPGRSQQAGAQAAGRGAGFWDDAGWIAGADGKARRVPQSGVRGVFDGLSPGMAGVRPIPLLARGVPERVSKLKALGNAIVPQVAAEILSAMLILRP